ncbi:MAG: universal stress protein [Saprospiraceae bacterium]|nr:universal stress protein [Saprospiraceae bacterium]
MKKILIAIDYNPTAENVAKIGYAVAKAFQAEVVLVHVITDPAFIAFHIRRLWVSWQLC